MASEVSPFGHINRDQRPFGDPALDKARGKPARLGRRLSESGRGFGVAAAAIAAILFGTAYVATAFAIRSFTPLDAALWRGILATAVLGPAVVLNARRRPGSRMSGGRLWRLTLLGLSGGLGFVGAMNLAVSMSGATLAAFAASLSPILASVVAPLVLGEALTVAAAVGFGIAMVGTALLSGTNTAEVGPGMLAGLFAAFCFAIFLLLSRRWSRPYELSASAIALSIAATTALGLLPVQILGDPGQLVPPSLRLDAAVGLLWLALVPGVLAQLFVVASVRRVETSASAAMLLISPVTAAVLAAWLLGETMSPLGVLGAILILGGVVGAAVLERRPHPLTVGDLVHRSRSA